LSGSNTRYRDSYIDKTMIDNDNIQRRRIQYMFDILFGFFKIDAIVILFCHMHDEIVYICDRPYDLNRMMGGVCV